MKKILILLAVILSTNIMMAQKMDRTNAFMYNKNGQFDKAKESIEKCVNHDAFLGQKPKDQAQAWLYRGMIYLNIYLSPEYKSIDADALTKSYESFKKIIEIDPDFAEQNAQEIYPRISAIAAQYFQKGVEGFNTATYDDAATSFRQAYEISQTMNSVDTTALINAALASMKAHNYDQAISYYTDLQNVGYKEVDLYQNMATSYNGSDNTEKALEIINAGLEKFPGNAGLIIERVNINLKDGKSEEAINDLTRLNELDPNNTSILYNIGIIYGDENSNLYNPDKAIEYYSKAIELNPNYYDAVYNLGALYIAMSNKLKAQANDLPLEQQKEYDELIKQAEALISEGLPHVKKAYDMQPNAEVKAVLKSMYVQLKMLDEAKALEE